MQKGMRINEHQLHLLATQAKVENNHSGPLYKRNIDSAKWQLKWFALHHNLLYWYEVDGNHKLTGCTILEGCYAEEIVLPPVKDHTQVLSLCLHQRCVHLMSHLQSCKWCHISATVPPSQ